MKTKREGGREGKRHSRGKMRENYTSVIMLCLMVHVCEPSTWETEAKGLRVQGLLQLS